MNLEKAGNFFFKYRSYAPLPFLIIMLLFCKPSEYSIIIGFVVAVSGEMLRIWAVSYAGSETRTTEKAGGTFLITQGPFHYIRNPLYTGNILIYTGFGIMSNSLFPFFQIVGILYFILQYYCIILTEEKYLLNKFENKYEVYRNIVNRFIPSFRKISDDIKSGLSFNLKAGIISEKRTLQAFVFTIVIILIFYFFQIRIVNY